MSGWCLCEACACASLYASLVCMTARAVRFFLCLKIHMLCACVCMSVCVYVCVYVCVCVRFACMSVLYLCVCECVRMSVCLCGHVYTTYTRFLQYMHILYFFRFLTHGFISHTYTSMCANCASAATRIHTPHT